MVCPGVGMNWIDSLKAKSLLTICARLASTIGSTESVIQGTAGGSSFSLGVQYARSRSAMMYFALGKVGTQRPFSSRVFHVGWNTRLENGRWVPTFPKAKYIMADRERAYWTPREKDDPPAVPWITDSVLPIVEAKRAQIVKSDFAFNESIQFIPTPGHTIDHYSVLVGRPGQDALITGDMIHSPIQGKYPELGMRADYDSRAAGQTRRKVFERFCDEATLMCATHFPSPSTGRVRRWGDGYNFVA